MTRGTNATIAGFTLVAYIAAGMSSMAVAGNAGASALLAVIQSFCALVLGVTFYAITREEDHDLAMMGLICRVIEAAPGHGEIYFAVGSTIFSWLLLRGRMIPVAVAWLGVIGSAALVLLLAVQTAGFLGGPRNWSSPLTWAAWSPMLVFELALAAWLITKGITRPTSFAAAERAERPAL